MGYDPKELDAQGIDFLKEEENARRKAYKAKIELLGLHMNCNPNYRSGHASIAGAIADNKIVDLAGYVKYAKGCGIDYYLDTAEKWIITKAKYEKLRAES